MTSRDRLGDCEPSPFPSERNRLVNRLREQLWRYFPALLELEDNLGAEWLLELWEAAPTPDTASRLCEATIAKLLKRHRIRRFDAAFVANTLCRPPVRVAAETVEAASASPDLENSERWIRSRSGWHAARLSAGRTFHNVRFTSTPDGYGRRVCASRARSGVAVGVGAQRGAESRLQNHRRQEVKTFRPIGCRGLLLGAALGMALKAPEDAGKTRV